MRVKNWDVTKQWNGMNYDLIQWKYYEKGSDKVKEWDISML